MNKAVLAVVFLSATPAFAQHVKDFVDVAGADSNELTGIGVVIGLNGNGDSPTGPSATRLSYLLRRFSSIDSPTETIKSKNAALVFVTAVLPPFAKKGSAIDVRVSAVGDAKSLVGGELMVTDLWSVRGQVEDGKHFAIASGRLIAQGEGRTANPTAGTIPNGAIVDRELKTEVVKAVSYPLGDRVSGLTWTTTDERRELENRILQFFKSPTPVIRGRAFRLNLRRTDLALAGDIAHQINEQAVVSGKRKLLVARAADGGTIEILVPSKAEWEFVRGEGSYPFPGYYDDPVSWIQVILDLRLKLASSPTAVVTINDVTKTITWTKDVKVRPGEVRTRGGAILQIPDEITLGEAMRLWSGTVAAQDLIDAVRQLDAAGLLLGRVVSK